MPIFPPTRRPTVDLVVFGDGPTEMVPIARRTLRDRFGVDPGVRRVEPVDHYANRVAPWGTDAQTYYLAEELLEPTTDASEADREIGLVAEPLALDERPGIFGIALVGASAAVITSDRLSGDDEQFESRVEKQVTKQFGRLFGFETTHAGCVFADTSTVSSLDETPSTFCDSCRNRLTNPATSPKPPDWLVRDTDVYRERSGDDVASGPVNETDKQPTTGAEKLATAVTDDRVDVTSQSAIIESRLPSDLRRPVHGIYRYARLWALILCFVTIGLFGMLIELALYERLIGSEPPTAVVWGMLVGAVAVGYYGQLTARRWLGRGWVIFDRS